MITAEYNLGDKVFTDKKDWPHGFSEMKAVVHYPRHLPTGKMPVVVLLHGQQYPCYSAREQDWDTLRDAEYIAVAGPSGCGKSTFLAILGLLETPTKGRYWLSGRPVDQLSAAERARARNIEIGLIFQTFNLLPTLTATENVSLPLRLD